MNLFFITSLAAAAANDKNGKFYRESAIANLRNAIGCGPKTGANMIDCYRREELKEDEFNAHYGEATNTPTTLAEAQVRLGQALRVSHGLKSRVDSAAALLEKYVTDAIEPKGPFFVLDMTEGGYVVGDTGDEAMTHAEAHRRAAEEVREVAKHAGEGTKARVLVVRGTTEYQATSTVNASITAL